MLSSVIPQITTVKNRKTMHTMIIVKIDVKNRTVSVVIPTTNVKIVNPVTSMYMTSNHIRHPWHAKSSHKAKL